VAPCGPADYPYEYLLVSPAEPAHKLRARSDIPPRSGGASSCTGTGSAMGTRGGRALTRPPRLPVPCSTGWKLGPGQLDETFWF
jgi:hypothetical protein